MILISYCHNRLHFPLFQLGAARHGTARDNKLYVTQTKRHDPPDAAHIRTQRCGHSVTLNTVSNSSMAAMNTQVCDYFVCKIMAFGQHETFGVKYSMNSSM